LSLATLALTLSVATDPAHARGRRGGGHHHAKLASASSSYNPPYADIVIDARNGSVLHAAAPDAPRHPASLTKIMTLYLLFERLESGKMTLDTQMPVSELASEQAPTKLGLKTGSTLKVDDAIKGLVTKSANDAAMVIAETIGGNEDEFGRMMTRKARALGMRGTTYVNPNGLPADEQITTARDQALLGIAIQERFPKYYKYFSLGSFVYRGATIRNHNHLLGQIEGMDGIKTGYTRDSGFNLVTSVRRGPRHIVAVVLGGRSAGSRDARMRELIDTHFAQASSKDADVAETPKAAPQEIAKTEPTPVVKALAASAAVPPPALAPGSTAPITPVKVKTVTVRLVAPKTLPAAEPGRATAFAPVEDPATDPMPAPATVQAISTPASKPGVLGKLPVFASAAKDAVITTAKADDTPAPARHLSRGGWAIQVGAYEDEGEAKQHLTSAKGKVVNVFEKAEGYIERTVKGAKTYFRARFSGFDRDGAEAACKKLKRENVACLPSKS
jgi:D-alanyl-D-alanine carboxypeptidase